MPSAREPRRIRASGVVFALVGVALFAWFVRQAGAADIWKGVVQVGCGFAAIAALNGLRFAMRAFAWTRCLAPPHAMRFRDALGAILAGDALGNLTPLGLIASEPAKAAFVRHRVPIGPALTALAIENLVYTLSVAAMIGAATAALLVNFTLPRGIAQGGAIAVALIAAGFGVTAVLLWRQPAIASRALALVVPSADTRVERVRQVERDIYTFAARRRAALWQVFGAYAIFHLLSIAEVYLTWTLIARAAPPLLDAFVVAGAERLIVVLFKFVPLRVGVDELGTGTLTQLLGHGALLGGTIAIVRKMRVVVWVVVGLSLLVRRSVKR